MILISSAAYIDQDMSAEVGLIPPSFLPIGNKRLYEHQIEALFNESEDIYLSLPGSYNVSDADLSKINKLGATVLFVPDDISLGESVLYSWCATGRSYSQLKILHGDTLFLEFSLEFSDFVMTSRNQGAYHRAEVELSSDGKLVSLKQSWVNDSREVLSGFFSFTCPQFLMKCIVETKNDFVASLVTYSKRTPLYCMNNKGWLDFGHLNSFFISRTAMTTQRAFNDLQIVGRVVTKKSNDTVKMRAESHWFDSLPTPLRMYLPALLEPYHSEEGRGSYSIEYLYYLPLSDLFVFGNHSEDVWVQIFSSAQKTLDDFNFARRRVPQSAMYETFNGLYLTKTLERLAEYGRQSASCVDELKTIAEKSSIFISEPCEEFVSIVHGDFCFSNILYDSRTQTLRLIDPRGLDAEGRLTVLGDRRYDLAKLFHSAVGCYDLIIAGRYEIIDDEIKFYDCSYLKIIESAFNKVFFHRKSFIIPNELIAINIHLFLSMLPLHDDRPDRQRAMILNAKRLFMKLMDSL